MAVGDAIKKAAETAKKVPQASGAGSGAQEGQAENEGGISSPEGILMLTIAAIFDLIGFVLFLLSWLGLDDYGVLDILGLVVFGGWVTMTRGIEGGKKILPKFCVTFGVELVPILGSASPSWIIFVWSVLKN